MLGKEEEPVSAAQTEKVLFSIITQISFLPCFIYCEQQKKLEHFSLPSEALVCIVVALSSAPGKGQALSLGDIFDKKCQVSGVVQPNTSD